MFKELTCFISSILIFSANLYASTNSVRELTLRQTESYARAKQFCLGSLNRQTFKYAFHGGASVFKLLTFEEEEYYRMIEKKTALSAVLAYDLGHEGFYLALKDCGISPQKQKQLVNILVAADIGGKVVATLGVVATIKASAVAIALIRAKSAVAYWTLTTSTVTAGVYQYYMQYKKLKDLDSTPLQNQTNKDSFIANSINLDSKKAENDLLFKEVIQILEQEKKYLVSKLQNAKPEQEPMIRMQLNDIEAKLHLVLRLNGKV